MATKADLLAEAEGRNLDVSESNTKAEIEDALKADGYTGDLLTAESTAAGSAEGSFTNMPAYDKKAHGLDYGGDGEGAGNLHEVDAAARERGYFGNAPGDEVDGDLTVKGVGGATGGEG